LERVVGKGTIAPFREPRRARLLLALVKYKWEGWNDERGIEVGNATSREEFDGWYNDM